jgi:hypothetical protein
VPVSPPQMGPLERFEPRFLTDGDLDDVASFTGLDRNACLERVQSYSMQEMAEAWRQADPPTPNRSWTSTGRRISTSGSRCSGTRARGGTISGWRFTTW